MKSSTLLDCCTLFVVFLQFTLLISGEPSSELLRKQSSAKHQAEKKLVQLCRGIREMKHLSRMQELINLLRLVMGQQDFIEFQKSKPTKGWMCGLDPTCTGSSWQMCADQADAIVDLEPLIAEQDNVCKSSHIDKIEAYRNRYVRPHEAKPITYNFFFLYAAQVSITCKKNLLHSLSVVNENIAKESYEKVVSWLAPFEQNKSCNRDLSEIVSYGSRNHDLEHSQSNTGKCCDSIKVFTKIKQIDEIVHELGYDKGAVKSHQRHKPGNVSRQPSRISGDSKSPIPDSVRDSIDDMRETCAKLEPIYTNTIIPIVRLAGMRIDPEYKQFDKRCKEEKLIQHWFIITLVCNSMLSCNLVKVPQTGEGVIQEDALPVSGILQPDDHAFLILNTLEDELWIKKYLPSRLSKLKSEFVKSITKTFKIDELLENPNLKKGVKFGQNAVIGMTLVGLTLAGMDSDTFF